MLFKKTRSMFAAAAFVAAITPSFAAPIAVSPTNNVGVLTSALVQSGTGLVIQTSNLVGGSATQQGTHTGVNLAPASGSGPSVSLASGVVLSTGRADIGASNTANETTASLSTGGYAALTTLAGITTYDANVLEYTFTLGAGLNGLRLDFIFMTEEFPTQSVTDIFGVFVDGVNYATFPNGDLISNTPGNPTNFIANPVNTGLYETQYNGLTRVLSLAALVDPTLSTHTLRIAIADTSDNLYDSGVYLANLRGANISGTGGIGDDPAALPEPGTLALIGATLFGMGALRRRRS